MVRQKPGISSAPCGTHGWLALVWEDPKGLASGLTPRWAA